MLLVGRVDPIELLFCYFSYVALTRRLSLSGRYRHFSPESPAI
jgi:hypothetical protein